MAVKHLFWAALALLFPSLTEAYLQRYIIVSLPEQKHVQYIKVQRDPMKMGKGQRLITDGLKNPIGLAVDDLIPRLYVADPASKSVFGYNLVEQDGDLMTNGLQQIICGNVDIHWLAVNAHGDLFMTEGAGQLVLHIPGKDLRKGMVATSLIPHQLFNGAANPQVSTPTGVATDGNHVFWSNGANGLAQGTVIRAKTQHAVMKGRLMSSKTQKRTVMKLAQNADAAGGQCVALANGFFITKSPPVVWGYKKDRDSTNVVRVANMVDPKGCAWDKDGTIYVSDPSLGRIYKFAANMPSLHMTDPRPVAEENVDGATGLAVFVGSDESKVRRWEASAPAAAFSAAVLGLLMAM